MPDPRRMHARRRIAVPLECGQRLHDVRAEIVEVEERLELRPVPRRPRSRHHRVRQFDRPNPSAQIYVHMTHRRAAPSV